MIPNLIYGKAIGITAGIVVRKVGGDVWTSMLIGFLIGTLIVMLTSVIAIRLGEESIVQFTKKAMGPRSSYLLGIILCIYFAVAFTVSSNVLMLHLKEYFLPQTPFLMLCIVYIALCTYGALLGVEVIIRFSFFGFIMTILINITMVIGTFRDFRFYNLQPIFDRGIIANLIASQYVFLDISMIILSMLIIYPMLNNKKNINKITLWGTLLGIINVIIWPVFETGVLGADVMKQFVVVCMQQVRSAELTQYLPRYELIMVSFFVWGLFVQSVVMLYCSMYCFKQATRIKRDPFILIPLAIICVLITNYQGKDHNHYIKFLANIWTPVSVVLGVGIPIVLAIVMIFRRRKLQSR
jgi:spore germination protein KB